MHRCMLGHDWLQARCQPLIHPATPYSSCHGGSLPPRVFSAASSVVTMATAAWPWVLLLQLRQAWPEFRAASEAGCKRTRLQQLTRFSLLAAKTLWVWVKTSMLLRHGWAESAALLLLSPARRPGALSAICKCCHENVGREKSWKSLWLYEQQHDPHIHWFELH